MSDEPILAFPNAISFTKWLSENPRAPAVWLKFAKKRARAATVSKSEAIDCALCFGWIDGQLAPLDDEYFLTRFTPRRRGARWSAANVSRAEALIAAGRMQSAGLAEIEAAKADGRWAAAYPSASTATVPEDFAAALAAQPAAAQAFAALDGANRYAVLYRLHHAKDRAKAVAAQIARLARGETYHPPRQRGGSRTKAGAVGNSTPS